MTNGLAGTQFIDPITFGPDWFGFNPPGTAEPWITKDAFARPTVQGTLGYPPLPESRYVFEVELTLNRRCSMNFQLGDPKQECHIALDWIPERDVITCALHHWEHGLYSSRGQRDFAPGSRIRLKLVVGDGRQTVFHEGEPISSHSEAVKKSAAHVGLI